MYEGYSLGLKRLENLECLSLKTFFERLGLGIIRLIYNPAMY